MDHGKLIGAAICIAALSLTAVFLWGISARAYWAIAVPIAVLVVVSMALLFWVGWTFITTEPMDTSTPEDARRSGRLLR